MKSKKYESIYMKLACEYANHSHCIKRHVGAVLTKDTRVIATGYNGPPENYANCDIEWPDKGCQRDANGGCSHAIHAEQNAIMHALRNGADTTCAELFVTLSPCLPCAKLIHSSGITRVVYLKSYAEYKGLEVDEGVKFLKDFGIQVEKFDGQIMVV